MVPQAQKQRKTGTAGRWSEGVWLGIREESGEALIGTSEGVFKARSIRRKATGKEKWKMEMLTGMRGVPWATGVKQQRDADVRIDIPGQEEEVRVMPEVDRTDGASRRFHIRIGDIRKHGETRGCTGCRAMLEGRRGKHSEECRKRFEEALISSGDMRITRMLERMAEEALEKLEGEQNEAQDEAPEGREGAEEESDSESSDSSSDSGSSSSTEPQEDDPMAPENDTIMAVVGMNK